MRATRKELMKQYRLFYNCQKNILIFICIFFSLYAFSCTHAGQTKKTYGFSCTNERFLQSDAALDLYCLRLSYPQIDNIFLRNGSLYLKLRDGKFIPYETTDIEGASIKDSLSQIYPLDPMRPDTPAGFAPGRQRPYALFGALYGNNAKEVSEKLNSVTLLGKSITLAQPAAQALEKARFKLEKHAAENPKSMPLLKADGGFCWRLIAGEHLPSPHSYGIAFDIGARHAPYWRWSKQMPHPMQKSYPSEIVQALENQGFIWGGKWHEYDLMHFEYRPELICKAKMKRAMQINTSAHPDVNPLP